MDDVLQEVAELARPHAAEGKVADYIPALAEVPPDRFAIAVVTADGDEFTVGDADMPFSIQSISKLFMLALAMEWSETDLWQRVGREPSGMRFNSLIQLETEKGIPRNPFINAGAIVIADALLKARWNIETSFRNQMRLLSGNQGLQYDGSVFRSEQQHGDLNRAIAFVLKAYGNLHDDPMKVTSAYFRACSMAMSARDLARAGMFLVRPQESEAACAKGENAKRIRAIMRTCGLYDQSGEFAYRVGMPGKSGVGGGIIVTERERFSICVWSPPLDKYGNSVAGQLALEALSKRIL